MDVVWHDHEAAELCFVVAAVIQNAGGHDIGKIRSGKGVDEVEASGRREHAALLSKVPIVAVASVRHRPPFSFGPWFSFCLSCAGS
jgi:hypothetical protein